MADRKFWRKELNHEKIFKDNNLIEMNSDLDNGLIKFSKLQAEDIERLLILDTRFLRKHGLMDYSLLLAIEHVKIEPERMRLSGDGITDIKNTVIQEVDNETASFSQSMSQSPSLLKAVINYESERILTTSMYSSNFD